MIGMDDAMRLANLRERIYRCVEDELNRDDHHKSYEGALEVTLSFPSIFERADPPTWMIELHAYVLPLNGRHESWSGRTLAEALAKAEHSIDKLAAPYEMKRFERRMDAMADEPGEATGERVIYGDPRPAPAQL